MSDIKRIIVQIKKPSGSFPGQVCEGAYIVEDGVVTLVGPDGKPALDGDGNRYTHKLGPNDNERAIAGMLTRELRKALRGGQRNPDGPIDYPRDGSIV